MLARKYDNYAWEEQVETKQKTPRTAYQLRREAEPHSLLRRRIAAVLVVLLFTYLFSVIRSQAQAEYAHELVMMQKQETQLINKNNELKIEVEQLKGPDRIIGLAEQRLGMSVARSNIYVKNGPKQ